MKCLSDKIILCAGLVSLMATTLLSSNAFAELQKVGVVGAANQTLSAVDETKQSRNLTLGKDVFFNDTLSTDGSGNAQLMFLDKSALTIGPNSSVVVDKFVYNPADGGGALTMRGTKGAFRFIGGALSKKQEVQFKTPVGTIGIRGGIAIVEINPTSGATNATFLYGEKMTFQNLAGQKQETTNSGFGISVLTPTSLPTVPAAVSAATLAAITQKNFVSGTGQTGGVSQSQVPTNTDMDKKSITGEATATDKKNAPINGGTGGGQGGQGGNNNGAGKTGTTGTGAGASGSNGQQGQNNQSGQNGNSGNAAQPGQNGNNNGPNGAAVPNAANGAPMGGAVNPGVLTADGGYIDSNGVQHSAADLAAFRLAQANAATTGNNNAGGAAMPGGNNGGYVTPMANGAAPAPVDAAGGYVPAGGTAAAGGGYYTPAGVYTPAPAPAPVVGGYDNFGVYTAPAMATNTFFAYNAPVGTVPINGTNYYNPAGYVDPTNLAAVAQAAIIAAQNTTNNYNNLFMPPAFVAGGDINQYNLSVSNGQATFTADIALGKSYAQAQADALATFNLYIVNGNNGNGGNGTTLVDFTALQTAQDVSVNSNIAGNSVYSMNDIPIGAGQSGTDTMVMPVYYTGAGANDKPTIDTQMQAAKNTCTNGCQYVNWGTWAHIIPDSTSTSTNTVMANVVPYVYGTITPSINIPFTGNATYNGSVAGNILSGGTVNSAEGVIHATINLNGGSTSIANGGITGNLGGYNFTNGATINFSGASFNGALGISGAGTGTGSIKGSLFGPGAQSVGGNLNFNAGAATGAGVYIGSH